MPTERVLADFAGDWSLERTIIPASGAEAQFRGTAHWRPTATGLDYEEIGILHVVGATPMRATRRYRWTSDMSVYFEDGRFFHKVPALGGQATHWCDPDSYMVRYDFSDWPRFRTTWTVNGPHKDYTMINRYTRLPPT